METNYLFIYRRDKPFFINVISGFLILFAIIRLLNSPISSAVMIVVSIGLFTYQTGIEINMTDKKYRNVSVFGPQIFGNWTDLPQLEYITLFKTKLVFAATGTSGASVSQKSSVFQVGLVTIQKKKIKIFEGKDFIEAVTKAKEFREKLKLDIWDATIRPADWYADNEPLLT